MELCLKNVKIAGIILQHNRMSERMADSCTNFELLSLIKGLPVCTFFTAIHILGHVLHYFPVICFGLKKEKEVLTSE